MARIYKAQGLSTILKNLKKVSKEKEAQLEKGLLKAGRFLQRQSQKIVPVDTGALRASAFTRVERTKKGELRVRVGYTMHYAVYVHEDLYARHKRGKTAKYLEIPAREFKGEILKIIRDAMKAKKGGRK